MPEGLQDSAGNPLDVGAVEQEFARAMAADTTDIPAPRKPAVEVSKLRLPCADQAATPKPRAPRTKHDRPRTARSGTAAAKPVPSGPEADKRRSDGIKGIVQMGAGLCLVADQRVPGDAFKADALTLANSAETLADACVATAQANPRFAALLDKVTNAGPYAALITVTLSVGAQLARNHGVTAGEMLGAVPPEKLLATLDSGNGPADPTG